MKAASSNTPLDSHFPDMSGPGPMVDFVSGFYTVHGPNGERVDPATIPCLAGSRLLCGSKDFPACRWQSFRAGGARTFVSYRRRMFWISGNPAGAEGSNMFATKSPEVAERRWLDKLLISMGLIGYSLRFVRRTRLDVTNQIDCESEDAAHATAVCLRHTLSAPWKRKNAVKGTTYLSQRTHGWTVRVYSSVEKPGSVGLGLNSEHPDIRHFLRIEVCLRGPEQKHRGIDRLQLAGIDLFEEFRSKIIRCRTAPGNLCTPSEPPPGLRKENRGHYLQWASGECGLKKALPRWTYSRVRKTLMEYGFDIAFPPNLAPDAWGKALRWNDVCHPSRWFATRFSLDEVVLSRLRRRLNTSMHRRDLN